MPGLEGWDEFYNLRRCTSHVCALSEGLPLPGNVVMLLDAHVVRLVLFISASPYDSDRPPHDGKCTPNGPPHGTMRPIYIILHPNAVCPEPTFRISSFKIFQGVCHPINSIVYACSCNESSVTQFTTPPSTLLASGANEIAGTAIGRILEKCWSPSATRKTISKGVSRRFHRHYPHAVY